jgi:hypothetical protein
MVIRSWLNAIVINVLILRAFLVWRCGLVLHGLRAEEHADYHLLRRESFACSTNWIALSAWNFGADGYDGIRTLVTKLL